MTKGKLRQKAGYDVIIVGGGITGLTAAWLLQRHTSCRFALLEADSRLGGKIGTEHVRVPSVGSLLLERGPDALLTTGGKALDLVRELNLNDHLLPMRSPDLPVYLFIETSGAKEGTTLPLPTGLHMNLPTQFLTLARSRVPPWHGKLRALLELALPASNIPENADESVGRFIRRRFGAGVLEHLAEPLLSGIFNTDPDELSLLATLPRLRALERRYGSVLRGLRRERTTKHRPAWPFVSFQAGMGSLIDALTRALPVDCVHTNSPVQRIERHEKGGYRILLTRRDAGSVSRDAIHRVSTETLHARAVFITTPARAAGDMLSSIAPRASEELRALAVTSSAALYAAFHKDDVPHKLQGSGLLIPKRHARVINAMTWASSKFAHRAPPDVALLRLFMGGGRNPQLLERPEAEIQQQALADVNRLLRIRARPLFTKLYTWHHRIPQYRVGHLDRINTIESGLPRGVFVAGASLRGASIDACIARAKAGVEQIQSLCNTRPI
ncbi:MAG: protoporphyrinogen oxidase [Myxococcota bacterium]